MDGLWIDPVIIMIPKRTWNERVLLARICFRAAGSGGVCTDSNTELRDAIAGVQSVSDLVNKLHNDGLINASIDKDKANKRSIKPAAHLLKPYADKVRGYKENPDSKRAKRAKDYKEIPDSTGDDYKEKPDSDYKENPDSAEGDYKEKPDSTIRKKLIDYKENPDSYNNKDKRIIENNKEKQQLQQRAPRFDEGDVVDEDSQDSDSSKKNSSAQTPPPTPSPVEQEEIPATEEEVRAYLLTYAVTRRYAFERMKLAKTDEDYSELVEIYISQRLVEVGDDEAPFKSMKITKKHFTNWLGSRANNNIQLPKYASSNSKAQTASNKRGSSSLRSTAIGAVDYRGEGSTCDVEL